MSLTAIDHKDDRSTYLGARLISRSINRYGLLIDFNLAVIDLQLSLMHF
jgi:hypothetical protein